MSTGTPLTDRENAVMRWCNEACRTNPSLVPLITMMKMTADEKNFHRLLPLYFRFENKPVSLTKHFPFEVCFDSEMPPFMVKMCARQTGKTFQNVLESIMELAMVPNFTELYVMQFFEMVRRLSTLYVSPLIEESHVKAILVDKKRPNQVLQRSFPNGSNLVLAYAYNNADRVRGLNAKKMRIDEAQLVLLDVVDVIQRTMDGSVYGNYEVYSGTPTTLNGTLHHKWMESSQSEWVIPCRNPTCIKENIASVEYDLENMIGPWSPDISPDKPGLVCAKCRSPLFVQDGHWQSRYPERWLTKRGIHIPQPIMPWHNQSAVRWASMLQVVNDPLLPRYKLFNEVYGEPFDSGGGLLGEGDMKRAACLNIPYDMQKAIQLSSNYSYRIVAIDWGGGVLRYLDREEAGPPPLSRTKLAVLGLSPSGKIDVLWGWENPNPLDRILETRMVLETLGKFGCHGIAYDTGNGGYFSELIIKMQHSFNARIFRIGYGANLKQEMMRRHAPNEETGEGEFFNLDKTRSLLFTARAIQSGVVRFFNPYSTGGSDKLQILGKALLSDFTHLTQEQIERAGGGSFSIVGKEYNTSDDFAHAVNFGACAIWHQFGYPNLLDMMDYVTTPQDVAGVNDLLVDSELLNRMQTMIGALSV